MEKLYKTSPAAPPRVYSVFVGRIPLNMTQADLVALFKDYETLCKPYVRPPTHGDEYTYGFVRFTDKAAADRAIKEMNNWPVMGSTLRVEMANNQPSSSPFDQKSRPKPTTENYENLRRVLTAIEQISNSSDVPVSAAAILEAAEEVEDCLPTDEPYVVPNPGCDISLEELDSLVAAKWKT